LAMQTPYVPRDRLFEAGAVPGGPV
jgi:hypothetical protein